jgi:hypothetical protein
MPLANQTTQRSTQMQSAPSYAYDHFLYVHTNHVHIHILKCHCREMSSDGENVRKQKKTKKFTGTMEENVAYGKLKDIL